MPQLNPIPWLSIMTIAWAALIFIFLNKILNSHQTKLPAQKEQTKDTTISWVWPWS